MLRQGLFDRHRLDVLPLLFAGATPVAQKRLGPVPQGYAWYVENAAFTVAGNSHTATIDLAVVADDGVLPAQASWDHAGLVWTVAAAIRSSVNFANAICLREGEFLVAYLAGGTAVAGDSATVTVQVAVHQLNPAVLMSPEDRRAVAAAHENEPVGVNRPATAFERAV